MPIASISVRAHLDLEALSERPAATCVSNDIALVRIDLGRKVALDLFADQRETGSFVLIDPITGTTVASGVVTRHCAGARAWCGRMRSGSPGTCSSAAWAPTCPHGLRSELRRRANEVAILMRGAGVAVEIDDTWRSGGIDPTTVWLGLIGALSFRISSAPSCWDWSETCVATTGGRPERPDQRPAAAHYPRNRAARSSKGFSAQAYAGRQRCLCWASN